MTFCLPATIYIRTDAKKKTLLLPRKDNKQAKTYKRREMGRRRQGAREEAVQGREQQHRGRNGVLSVDGPIPCSASSLPPIQTTFPLSLPVFIYNLHTKHGNPPMLMATLSSHHLHGTLEIYIYNKATLTCRLGAMQYSTATLCNCRLQ
uniref:Uncharacterized protein n=1 Tax=Setaria italica TaxID=4555 RepID=K3XQJ7_SETIT